MKTTTVSDIITAMPAKTFSTRAAFRRAVFRECVRVTACEPCNVRRDRSGNCVVCGEAGRCCGYHFLGELTASQLFA